MTCADAPDLGGHECPEPRACIAVVLVGPRIFSIKGFAAGSAVPFFPAPRVMKRSAEAAGLLSDECLTEVVGRLRSAPHDAATHVRFLVGEREFHAHRWLVEMRIEKYSRALQSRYAESACNEWIIAGYDPATFEQLVAFLYTDDCDSLSSSESDWSRIFDLWKLSDELLFGRLANACLFKFSVRLNRDTCGDMLLASIESGFEPAIKVAWDYTEANVARTKGSARLEWRETDLKLTRGLGASVRAFYDSLWPKLYDNGTPEDRARLVRLFLHANYIASAREILLDSANNGALRPLVPLYEFQPVELLGLQPRVPWLTDSVVVESIRQRHDYLATLARAPRSLVHKPPHGPLEFMPLDPLLGWSEGAIAWAKFSPLRHSSAKLDVLLSRTDVAKDFWFVADCPSVRFAVDFGLPDADFEAEVGVLSAVYPDKTFGVSVKARFCDGKIHVEDDERLFWDGKNIDVALRLTPRPEAPGAWIAHFQGVNTTAMKQFTPGHADRTLFVPALRIRLLQFGRMTVRTSGDRWPGDRSQLAEQ